MSTALSKGSNTSLARPLGGFVKLNVRPHALLTPTHVSSKITWHPRDMPSVSNRVMLWSSLSAHI